MRFEEIENLWSVDLARLSRADQGRVFFERAKHVLADAVRTGNVPVERRRVSRRWLIKRIGCKPAATSQNPGLRALLVALDSSLGNERTAQGEGRSDLQERLTVNQSNGQSSVPHIPSKLGTSHVPVPSTAWTAHDSSFVSTNSSQVGITKETGLIVLTDSRCKIGGVSFAGIPTIVWSDGIDVAASDWLRSLVVKMTVAQSSAGQYAEVLRLFLRYCRRRNRDWTTVDDAFLIAWREHLRRAIGVGPARVNYCLDVVFAYFKWAEETKRIRYRVGIYDQADLPPDTAEFTFPISATRSFSKSPRGKVFGSWTTPLKVSVPRKNNRHTPTEEEVRSLHSLAMDKENGERDSLLLSWAEETGGRRAEILQVRVSDLPTIDELDNLIERDEPWTIEVIRKGNKRSRLHPLPDLLIRTMEFVEHGREAIVSRFRKELVGYAEPDEIFLSTKTGSVLRPDSVTALSGRLFRTAGIQKANIHRLRAKYAIQIIEALIDALSEDGKVLSPETILIAAAERMGQAHPDSLRPYLNFVLQRRLRRSKSLKAHDLAARIRELELLEAALVQRLKDQRSLQHAANLVRSGRLKDAAALLDQFAKSLARDGALASTVSPPGPETPSA